MSRRDGIVQQVSPRTGKQSYRARASWVSPDGERVHRSKTFRTRKEAERWRRETLAAVDRGAWFEPAPVRLAEIAEAWLATVERSKAASTYRQYRSTWTHHVGPRFGGTEVGRIRATDVQAFYDEMAARYAASTVAAAHKVLRGILAHAVTDGLVRANVAEGRRLPKDRPAPPLAWTPEEARRFLSATEGNDDALLYRVLLATGLRIGEALALAWSAVDLEARTLRVERTLQYSVAGFVIAEGTKTASSRRTVALPAVAVLALRRQRAVVPVGTELVFPAWHGGPQNPTTCRDHLARLSRAAGVPVYPPHVLRSTAVTLMLLAGTPIKVAAEQTGHGVELMLSRYQSLSSDLQRQAVAALDDVLDTGHGSA